MKNTPDGNENIQSSAQGNLNEILADLNEIIALKTA